METTEEERKALYLKLEDRKKNVKCPRCGALLEYKEYPTAQQVKCPTKGCLELNIRGI